MKSKVAIASDHAGYPLKELFKQNFSEVDWADFGSHNADRTDYPDYALKVAEKIGNGEFPKGVLICGSGIGMAIAANKINGVRAANVESEEAARLSRAHNNSNILCLGARMLQPEQAKNILKIWLETPFEGGRHEGRLKKIQEIEEKNSSSKGGKNNI